MKRALSLLICIMMLVSHMTFMMGCGQGNTDADKGVGTSSSDTAGDEKEEINTEKPEPSKDPADYEIPSGKSASFAITCVSYKSLGKTHFIDAFKSDDLQYYLIIPSSVDMQNVALYFTVSKGQLSFNGTVLTDTVHFFDFSENNTIVLQLTDSASKSNEAITLNVLASAAPVMYLDIDESMGTVSEMHADTSKNTHCYGVCYVDSENDAHDTVTYFDIHGHGNSTWKSPKKKPYNIKFTEDDSYDNGRKVSLLGMRASSKWCLLADVWDISISRNWVAQYMGGAVEAAYSIQSQYVNLFFNGEYRGSYLALERAKSIDEVLDLDLVTHDNMDGSWLFEFDNQSGQENQFTVGRVKVTLKTDTEGYKYSALKKHLEEVSVALDDPRGVNKTTGKYYYDYIDLESYAKYLLIREFTMDYDTVVNHWAYYDASDGKIHAGALWDFDNSMGNGLGSRGDLPMYHDTSKLLIFQDEKGPGCWLIKLMQFKEFRDALKEQYEKYSYLFDVEDERCIYNVFESRYPETKLLAEQNDLYWGFLSKRGKNTGFEQDDSVFATHYGELAKFLYDRCKAYGGLIEGL